jgi:Fe-S cluster biogenesis protein NfuA
MIDEVRVRQVLDEASALVQADGGVLELLSVDAGSGAVALRLAIESADCADCILPGPLLTDLVGTMLRRSISGVGRVTIDDPRQPSGTVQGAP